MIQLLSYIFYLSITLYMSFIRHLCTSALVTCEKATYSLTYLLTYLYILKFEAS